MCLAPICVSSLRDVDTCRVWNVGGLSWGQCMHILEYKGCIMKIQISKDLKPSLGLPTKPLLTLSSSSRIRSHSHSQNTTGLIEHLELQSLPPVTHVFHNPTSTSTRSHFLILPLPMCQWGPFPLKPLQTPCEILLKSSPALQSPSLPLFNSEKLSSQGHESAKESRKATSKLKNGAEDPQKPR